MPSPALLRSRVNDLTTLAERDIAELWRSIKNAGDAAEPLRDILPGLVDIYGAAAATVAADWYDDVRAENGVRGRFGAVAAAPPVDVGAEALVGWALSQTQEVPAFQTLIEGGLQRRIANVARGTVMGSAVADPAATGWQRVSRGRCNGGFCDMLAGRGAVYRTDDSATFASHDHCQCVAIPAWSGRPLPVRPYTPSLRHVTDADQRRVREWITSN